MPELSPDDVAKLNQLLRKTRNIRAVGIALKIDAESIVIGPPLTRGNGTPSDDSALPAPTQRYQVYTPVDDTLVPIWTYPRFSS